MTCFAFCLSVITGVIGSTPASAVDPGVSASRPAAVAASAPSEPSDAPEMLPPARPAALRVSRDSDYRGLWWAAGRAGPFGRIPGAGSGTSPARCQRCGSHLRSVMGNVQKYLQF